MHLLKRLFGGKPQPAPPLATAPRPAPGAVTDATWEALVCVPGLTVVDFWADWCQPCTVMSAYMEFLARDFAGRLQLLALDVDENPVTSATYDVMGLPTLLYLRDGVEVERIVGITHYDALKRTTARLLIEEAGMADIDG